MSDPTLYELIGIGIGASIVGTIWLGVETYRLRRKIKASIETLVGKRRV